MESETATESVPAKESISESLDAPLSEKVNITLEFGFVRLRIFPTLTTG